MAEKHFKYVILGGGVAGVSSYHLLLFDSFVVTIFCFSDEFGQVDESIRRIGN
jgi:monoamine oxidase